MGDVRGAEPTACINVLKIII